MDLVSLEIILEKKGFSFSQEATLLGIRAFFCDLRSDNQLMEAVL